MEVKVLGLLEGRVRDVCVVPTACKPRQIFALLALNAGHAVSVPVLMEELWGENPPRSASTTLQTYILQLRRLLEGAMGSDGNRAAKSMLCTRFNGYMLDIPPQDVDVYGYDQLASAGRKALDMNDAKTAAQRLRDALDVWRGPVFADVNVGPRLSAEQVRLEESRLVTLESRIEADLILGRHYAVLSELSVLAAQHPWHENLHAYYMIALYRTGRQWQALDVYRRLRDTLVGEFGLEPSGWPQHLQRAILSADPSLEQPWLGGPMTRRRHATVC
ncbi:BTAD domain-containing putative transcriptional regulator [Streptomyces sioyaensis]|uniref:AfsR/SARP family transcriptional regulator n=1 Tax=Streptomyces sioyaensis TaxID=67364 RepID=UPI0037D484E2